MSVPSARFLASAFGAPLGAIAALVLFAPAPLGAQGTFEGMIAYRIQGMPGEMRVYQQGKKMRQEMVIEGMSGATPVTIVDGATGTAITLMPMQKQFMKMSIGATGDDMAQAMMAQQQPMPSDAPDFAAMRVTATGRRETVAGIACDHYVFTSTAGGEKIDICGARGMGFMAGHGNPMSTAALMSLGSRNSVMAKLAKEGFFPLKMTMSAGEGQTLTWEVTKVEKKKLEASLFAVPAGYKEFTMPGMPRIPAAGRP